MDDIFLYIIWNKAYVKKAEILDDLKASFEIIKIVECTWSKELFTENLNRFYGEKLPSGSFKEKACGTGPFTLVVLRDPDPVYEKRKTTRGIFETVNIHTFDKKKKYRSWTNDDKGHNCIHGTNNADETRHDLTFISGLSPEDFVLKCADLEKIGDPAGSRGWKSLEELFYVLGNMSEYVVLRNFDGLPGKYETGIHSDIDILCDDRRLAADALNAKKAHKNSRRSRYAVNVAGETVYFDLRYTGDDYYCKEWEKEILKSRKDKGAFFVPDDENFKYSLLYHALIQKKKIASDYRERFKRIFGTDSPEELAKLLAAFMKEKGYTYSDAYDYSVFFNKKYAGRSMRPGKAVIRSIRFFIYGSLRRIKKAAGRG